MADQYLGQLTPVPAVQDDFVLPISEPGESPLLSVAAKALADYVRYPATFTEALSRGYASGPVGSAYCRAYQDLLNNFWDPVLHRIRPTRGIGGVDGLVDNNVALSPNEGAAAPTFWIMCQVHNAIYEHWKLDQNPATALRIQQNWTWLKGFYGLPKLSSDGSTDNTIFASDDAAWKALYLAQVHEVTGDADALTALEAMIPATLARFADPTSGTQVTIRSGFTYSKYGILYVTNPAYGFAGVSTPYECALAQAALYVYQKTGDTAFLQYAEAVAAFSLQFMKRPSGNYGQGTNIDKAGTINVGVPYLGPSFTFGSMYPGFAAESLVGTLAAGILNAQLYGITGTATYLNEAKSITAALLQPNTNPSTSWGFVSGNTATTGVFLAITDPYTDGHFFSAFQRVVLPLTDTAGTFAPVLAATALSAASQRLVGGFYPADWGGAMTSPATAGLIQGFTTYQAAHDASKDSAANVQAGGQQAMVSAGTVTVIRAGALCCLSEGATYGDTPAYPLAPDSGLGNFQGTLAGPIRVGMPGAGIVQLRAGDGIVPGQVEFFTPDGIRRGYLGFAYGDSTTPGKLQINGDGGWSWDVQSNRKSYTPTVTVGGGSLATGWTVSAAYQVCAGRCFIDLELDCPNGAGTATGEIDITFPAGIATADGLGFSGVAVDYANVTADLRVDTISPSSFRVFEVSGGSRVIPVVNGTNLKININFPV